MSRTTVHTPFKHAVLTAPDREITHHGCQHDPEGSLRLLELRTITTPVEPGWIAQTHYVHHSDLLPAGAHLLGVQGNSLFRCARHPELCRHHHESERAHLLHEHRVYTLEIWHPGGEQSTHEPVYGVAECDAGQQNPGGCWIFAPSALSHFGRQEPKAGNQREVARQRERARDRTSLRQAAQDYNTLGEVDNLDEDARHY